MPALVVDSIIHAIPAFEQPPVEVHALGLGHDLPRCATDLIRPLVPFNGRQPPRFPPPARDGPKRRDLTFFPVGKHARALQLPAIASKDGFVKRHVEVAQSGGYAVGIDLKKHAVQFSQPLRSPALAKGQIAVGQHGQQRHALGDLARNPHLQSLMNRVLGPRGNGNAFVPADSQFPFFLAIAHDRPRNHRHHRFVARRFSGLKHAPPNNGNRHLWPLFETHYNHCAAGHILQESQQCAVCIHHVIAVAHEQYAACPNALARLFNGAVGNGKRPAATIGLKHSFPVEQGELLGHGHLRVYHTPKSQKTSATYHGSHGITFEE